LSIPVRINIKTDRYHPPGHIPENTHPEGNDTRILGGLKERWFLQIIKNIRENPRVVPARWEVNGSIGS
jgi:hypothetical protein